MARIWYSLGLFQARIGTQDAPGLTETVLPLPTAAETLNRNIIAATGLQLAKAAPSATFVLLLAWKIQ